MKKNTTKSVKLAKPAALPRLDERGRECAGGMTVGQRRKALAIVADVSKVMRLRAVNVDTGQYCLVERNPTEHVGQDLRDSLPALMSPAKPCTVCAQGALFLSFVRVYDKVVTPEFMDMSDGYHIETNVMKDELRAIFSNMQLALIESAFELVTMVGANGLSMFSADYTLLNDAIAFGNHYEDTKDRLRAILRNMRRHGGVFVPPPQAERA